jgi:prepilin-type N-terminal cleavage/methylation domain-containing protein
MQPQTTHHRSGRSRLAGSWPSGFTLVELLVVITIITIMMAIFTAVVGSMLGGAHQAATEATITKIHRVIQQRRDAFSTYQLKQSEIQQAMRLIQVAAPNVLTRREIRRLAPVVARKNIFRQAFPQNQTEKPLPGNKVSEADSAEVLYWVLTRGNDLGAFSASGIRFNSSELADEDDDGLLELIDGWGKPLRFYRWPTRLIRQDGPGTVVTPAHLAAAQIMLGAVSRQRFEQDPDESATELFAKWIVAQGANLGEMRFHTPSTWHAPLVVSCGPDQQLGLEEPHPNFNGVLDMNEDLNGNGQLDSGEDHSGLARPIVVATLFDNISNYNVQRGGN